MVNSRQKGASFERKICEIFTKHTGKKFNRTPGSGAFSTQTGDKRLAGDIYCIDAEFPWVIECKKYKDYDLEDIVKGKSTGILAWLSQLEAYCEKVGKPGMLIISKNYGKPLLFVQSVRKFPDFLHYKNYTIGFLSDLLPLLLKSAKKRP